MGKRTRLGKGEKRRRKSDRRSVRWKNAEKVNGHIDDAKTEAAGTNQTISKKQSSGLCLKFFYFLLFVMFVGGIAVTVLLGMEFDWNLIEIQAYVKTVAEKNVMVMKEKVKELRTSY